MRGEESKAMALVCDKRSMSQRKKDGDISHADSDDRGDLWAHRRALEPFTRCDPSALAKPPPENQATCESPHLAS
mgnify:CR=1 FL=1